MSTVEELEKRYLSSQQNMLAAEEIEASAAAHAAQARRDYREARALLYEARNPALVRKGQS